MIMTTSHYPPTQSEDCRTWHAATLETTPDGPRWVDTPEHTHVDADLLTDLVAAAAVADQYEIRDACPHHHGVVHAYRRG